MNRTDIKNAFRAENPEITTRVLSDALLNTWCKEGNLDFATKARLIVDELTFTTVADKFNYDLTEQDSTFFDIDDEPGGGVEYDDKSLDKSSMRQISRLKTKWRNQSSGTPKKYFRRGADLWFDKPTDADSTVRVYFVKIPDAFDDDNKTPYNQLTYLEPFHYGIVKYLEMRAMQKIGKEQDGRRAEAGYLGYLNFAISYVKGGRSGAIRFQGKQKIYYKP